MAEFRVVVIRPEATSGVATKLEASLEVNDDQGYELHTLVPFKDGFLAVFVKDEDEDMTSSVSMS
jgi:hypothetical protein